VNAVNPNILNLLGFVPHPNLQKTTESPKNFFLNTISTFGPYCGRILSETACSIFIGRIDPYRLLLVKHYQEMPEYDISARHKISIQWDGDIITSKKLPSRDKLSHENIIRASLTDEYTGKIYWKRAFLLLSDDLQNENNSY
jgi:hypothetical protein